MADETTPDETEGAAAASPAEAPATDNSETPSSTDSPQGASADDAASPAEPEVVLTPKERRARKRVAKAAKVPARGPRTGEERQAERVVVRAQKASARRTGREKARAKYKAEAHNRTATPPREHVAGTQKVRQGIVVSDKADKTITVRIDVARRHPKYEKIVRHSTKLHAHDEANDAHTGDTVTIREARPLSATKRWRLVDVIERAK